MALIQEFKKQGDFLFLYRGVLPILILIPALGICIYNEFYGTASETGLTPYIDEIALLVAMIGFAIRIHAVGHAPSGTSGRNTIHGQKAQHLNTTGLYSVMRHPLYLGNYLMWAGPGLLTLNPWFMLLFTTLFWLYYERIMFAEEQYLTGLYGEEYQTWSNSVPAFIPRITGYRASEFSFNWKKVLKREKNGLVAIFLVFWAFKAIPEVLKLGIEALHWDFWSIAVVVSLIYYVIIKVLQKTKSI